MSKKIDKPAKKAPHGRDVVADLAESIRVCEGRIAFYELRGQQAEHDKLVAEQVAIIGKAQAEITALNEQFANAPRMLKELAAQREQLVQRFLTAKNFNKVNQLQDLVKKAEQLAKELAEAQAAADAEQAQ